ncbi:Ubiquitin-like protease domain-containing protein [Abeliophyllum distichum]|uniref:Ubiquitin-like protease domain-containing protein n=1 Tax=Abeliophyllum distichum TaxID=126358 RepID=A0ABD1V6M2_9LAMI
MTRSGSLGGNPVTFGCMKMGTPICMKAIIPIPFDIDNVKTPEPRKRVTRPAACLQSPFVKSFNSQPNCSQKVEQVLFEYKFCLDCPATSDIKIFDCWYHRGYRPGNKVKKFCKDDLPIVPAMEIGPVSIDSKMWWYTLKQVATPLTDQHIDAMFYFLRMGMKLSGSNHTCSTTTDCYFDYKIRILFDLLTKHNNQFPQRNPLLLYVNGERPQFYTNWGEVQNVFIPIFLDKRAYWILGHFDIANWHLDVYNSAYKTIRDVVMMEAIQPHLNIIPHLLRQSMVLKFEVPDSPLSSRICKGTPQQTNGGDCGIFTVKYAEYIHEMKISTMPNPFDTKLARHNMAVQMYKHAIEKTDVHCGQAIR